MEKVALGGMKQSLELCQFDLSGPGFLERTVARVSRLLASQRINIAFITYHGLSKGFHRLTICPYQEDSSRTTRILHTAGALPASWAMQSREHVGIITIYPHRSPIKIVGFVMMAWASESIPIYGIATSLSAISFITDYGLIEKGIALLRNTFRLPDEHAPIQPELIYYQSEDAKKDKGK
jgi:aspartokinase